MFSGPSGRRTAAFLLTAVLALLLVSRSVRPQAPNIPADPAQSGAEVILPLPDDSRPEPPPSGQPAVSGPSPSSQETPPMQEAPPAREEPAIHEAPLPAEPSRPVYPSSYDFSQPAPAREAVDNSYFADAAFVGDSRTDGFMIYSGVGCGDKYVSNGLSIFQLGEKKALTIGGQKYTLLEALAMKQYKKVYLSLGVNELGVYDDAGFYRSYCQAIDSIRAIQPEAVIYIQGLIPLNEGVIAQTTKRSYLTNEHLRVYNDLMKQAAEEKQVVFLDLYSEFVDENNELPAEASRDGVHLLRDGYQKWLAYLKLHTVDYETLYPSTPPEDPTPELPAETPEIPSEGSVAL